MNEFYVYIYLDPRKPGTFTYGDYTFDYEPFYVGKGRGYRSLMTIQNSKDLNNKSHKFNKIRKIIKECNREPVVVKIDKNLSEDYSFQLEIWTIWAIGRYDLGTGPLTNLTDGGEGTTNISKETRIKKSNSMKKKWTEVEFRQLIIEKLNSSVNIEKQRKLINELWDDKSIRDKLMFVSQKYWKKQENKDRQSENTKKQWEDKDFRNLVTETLSKYWGNEDNRIQQSEFMKEWMDNPENKEKCSIPSKEYWSKEESRDKQSISIKKYFSDNPEVKKRLSEKSKQLWADPEYRQKQMEARKRSRLQKSQQV